MTESSLDGRHLRALRGCLAVSFAVMGVAVAWRELVYPGASVSFLYITCGWSEGMALRTSSVAAWVLVAASLLGLWRRGRLALVGVAAWMAWLSVLEMKGPVARPALVLGEHAVRIFAPLALAWLSATERGGAIPRGRERMAIGVLRVSAAATFACHGIEALLGNYAFLDLVFAAGDRLLGMEIEQETAELALVVIGVVDLAVAVAVLMPLRPVALGAAAYMAAWGFITAASRTVQSGELGLFDTFMRLPNGGVPLALVLYWSLSRPRS